MGPKISISIKGTLDYVSQFFSKTLGIYMSYDSACLKFVNKLFQVSTEKKKGIKQELNDNVTV
jgi:hypothetical protein